ncbi:MAG: quinolinate synthase NadA [Rikenellaceae bacterium]
MSVDIFKGYVDEELPNDIDLVKEINLLKKQKNAVIMAHYYTSGEVQDIADIVGDSLALSQQAVNSNADIILLAGVHFMAETAKVLSPDKKILIPDLNAGCSLADSCKQEDFMRFKELYPGYKVVSYVNTSVGIKALTDVACTSSNALQIMESFSKDDKLIFAPDRNLGNYIKKMTGREDIILWDGACHVHEEFSLEKIIELKKNYPEAKVVAHPECKQVVLLTADFIGSTAAILDFCASDSATEYIVATESGILHQLKKSLPLKTFYAAPPMDSTCGCNDCNYMKLNTLKKIYLTLKYELPFIEIDEQTRVNAENSIKAMLKFTSK